MKRFSRTTAHVIADEPGWPRHRTPSEWKYFVLAAAALIGLGIGWMSGKAISGWLPTDSPTLTVAERATPAVSPQAVPDEGQDSAVSTEVDQSAASVTQAGERRVVRHQRHARRQFFFKPFRVFRKLKIW